MMEQTGATSSQQVTAESNALLATKLHLPGLAPGHVVRPRLSQRLDDARAPGVVIVCAPAGFGKTALLAHWILRDSRAAAWLSLDPGDSDPARFWRHLVAAVERPHPGIATRVAALLEPAPPSFEGVVTALINAIGTECGDDGLTLILDDYHVIDSRVVHESMAFLLEHLPPGFRLVLTTRADPPLALARLRARGQLTELRASDLRFTAEEAASLLREVIMRDLPESAVDALAARTEGWAAGLHLAGLSLRAHADSAAFVESFSGSHRYVLDYLTEEVLAGQADPMRGFLLETSVLERLSGPLCDAVTGRTDSQTMLEQIEAAGMFLVPLDEVRGWWRYHHLFADLLRARLAQERPEHVATLHRNAAAWYEAHGVIDDAVHHAMAHGDMTGAARLTEKAFDAMYYHRGEAATVQRWMSALPVDVLRTRPRLLVAQAAVADAAFQIGEEEALLDAAEQAAIGRAEPFEPSAGAAASMLVNPAAMTAIFRTYIAAVRSDLRSAAEFADQASATVRPGEQMLELVSAGTTADVDWSVGRVEKAEHAWLSIIGRVQSAGQPNLIGWSAYHLGRIQCALGRLDDAQSTYEQAVQATAPAQGPVLPAAGVGYAGMAEVAYQRNDLDAALQYAAEGIALCRQYTFTPPLATALVTFAWISRALGDVDGARRAVDEAARAAPRALATDLLIAAPAQRARLLLVEGDFAGAERWVRRRGLTADDDPAYACELGYLVLARLLLARDRPDQALQLLRRMHTVATAQHRVGSVIEVCGLQALALTASGHDAEAVSVLSEALAMGHSAGYVRVFVDEGALMRTLLGRVLAAQRSERAEGRAIPIKYLAGLLRSFGDAAEPCLAPAAFLLEPLTARETEVLALLATGTSNSRIADELVVSIDTVKKHVSNVLRKLGALNRTEAVARGRQLGLVG